MNQKGFTPILVLVVVALGAIAIGSVAYFQLRPKPAPQLPTTTQPTAATSPAQIEEMAHWKTYTNNTLNYSIDYSPDMEVKEDDIKEEQEDLSKNNLEGKVVHVVNFSLKPPRTFNLNVQITAVTDINVSLKTYAEKLASGFVPGNIEEVNIGGRLGYKITRPNTYVAHVVVPTKSLNTFIVIGEHRPTTAQEEEDIFKKMLATFKFSD